MLARLQGFKQKEFQQSHDAVQHMCQWSFDSFNCGLHAGATRITKKFDVRSEKRRKRFSGHIKGGLWRGQLTRGGEGLINQEIGGVANDGKGETANQGGLGRGQSGDERNGQSTCIVLTIKKCIMNILRCTKMHFRKK